ncbi:hypothetical protein OU995_21425 [Roseateles sp. SL47]|uniref:hypothetical protein n=1 Tax=Roseateles sp. SL47 TaxID=2995138 RepID=UPI00226DCEB0|nr:hypothetical protein [Roseateles sp. SL47]WAC72105.1 hypothetical protein OU995_21425 [Roseateles sp. SL47]
MNAVSNCAALNQAKAHGAELDFWANPAPRCPHCGKTSHISDNDWWRLYEEGTHDVACPSCDQDFSVRTSVSYSFSTDQQP